MHLGYEYRPDGNFLVKVSCLSCEKEFDCHAMADCTVLDNQLCEDCLAQYKNDREVEFGCLDYD